MHRALYTEILEDAPADARERERQAIERSIELLNAAKKMGPASREANEALHYLDRLWSLLLDDLANAENRLPKELRASLISIGIWILREIDDLRSQRTQSFKGLIDISEIICKGLGRGA
jgi:flagellar protein FlaF